MANNYDLQEQIEMLGTIVDELSFLPFDFTSVIIPLRARHTLLQLLQNLCLELADDALAILKTTYEVIDTLHKDVRRAWAADLADWSSFRTSDKTTAQLGEYLKEHNSILTIAGIHAAQTQLGIPLSGPFGAHYQELVDEAGKHFVQKVDKLEKAMTMLSHLELVELLKHLSKSTKQLAGAVKNQARSQYRDLVADLAALHFLRVALSCVSVVDDIEPILSQWKTLCDETISTFALQERMTSFPECIRAHIDSSWYLRTASITSIMCQLCCSPKVLMSSQVLIGYRNMVETLEEEVRSADASLSDHQLPGKILEDCGKICQRARDQVLDRHEEYENREDGAMCMFYTWSEYYAKYEPDALLLLNYKGLARSGFNRQDAYQSLKIQYRTNVEPKERRLIQLAPIFIEELSFTEAVYVTEGNLISSTRILEELDV